MHYALYLFVTPGLGSISLCTLGTLVMHSIDSVYCNATLVMHSKHSIYALLGTLLMHFRHSRPCTLALLIFNVVLVNYCVLFL